MATKRKTHRSLRDPTSNTGLRLFAIPGIPEIRPGDDLVTVLMAAARRAKIALREGDVLVVAQKIVSKAEGALVQLESVTPSAAAAALAGELKKDARIIEVVLRESKRIVRSQHVLIAETRHGFVCANAGVDHSNVPGDDAVTTLPKDPDASARRLAEGLRKKTGKRLGVIISDTFGRPWRMGLTNVAIGASGLPVLRDLRGSRDRDGKPLTATVLAVADKIAAAAGLLMGKSEGCPVVVVRGYSFDSVEEPVTKMIRPAAEDLFR